MSNSNPHGGVQCPECGKRMFSYSRHDYRVCGCPNETMIDGGKDYLRYGWLKVKPTAIDWDANKDTRNLEVEYAQREFAGLKPNKSKRRAKAKGVLGSSR